MSKFEKDIQYYKFGFYGFLKNLRLFEPFLILFFLESGLSYLQIGILYSFREIARNIMEIPAGVIADGLGRKKSMIVSFSAYIVSFLLFFGGKTYTVFFIAMFLFAIGDAFRTGTHKAMIFDYLKVKLWENQKADYYGHTRAFSQFGSAISSLLSAILVFYTGSFRMIFIISVIPYLLDLLLLISYPNYLNGSISKNTNSSFKHKIKAVFKNFYSSFKNLYLLKVTFSISWYSGYYKLIKDFIQPMIVGLAIGMPLLVSYTDEQKSALIIGPVYFIIYLLTSLSSKNTNKVNHQFSSATKAIDTLMIIGISSGIISSLLYSYNYTLMAILMMIPVFIIENVRKPLGVSVIADNTPKEVLASILSVQSQFQTIIVMISAPLLGFLSDSFGLENGLLIVSTIFLIISLFVRIGKH